MHMGLQMDDHVIEMISQVKTWRLTSSRWPDSVHCKLSLSRFQTRSVESADADTSRPTSLDTARDLTSRSWAAGAPPREFNVPTADEGTSCLSAWRKKNMYINLTMRCKNICIFIYKSGVIISLGYVVLIVKGVIIFKLLIFKSQMQ